MRPGRRLEMAIHSLRMGDTRGAQQVLLQLIRSLRVGPGAGHGMRPVVRQLHFVVQNLRPGNEAWSIGQLMQLRHELRYMG
jgi:hypothetical protein